VRDAMLAMIRIKITAAASALGSLLRLSGTGRYAETFGDVSAVQQSGIASCPRVGAEGVVFRHGGLMIVLGTDDRGNRPALAPGDAAIYASPTKYVMVKADGSIEIRSSEPVTVIADTVTIGSGSGHKKLLHEDLIAAFNAHVHAGNGAPPTTPLTVAANATTKTRAL